MYSTRRENESRSAKASLLALPALLSGSGLLGSLSLGGGGGSGSSSAAVGEVLDARAAAHRLWGRARTAVRTAAAAARGDVHVAIPRGHVLGVAGAKGGDMDVVAVPYVFRYLCAELASMGIKVSLEVQ